MVESLTDENIDHYNQELDAIYARKQKLTRELSDTKKDLAKYLADWLRHADENTNITFSKLEIESIDEEMMLEAIDAFESTQGKVVTITEGGE